MSLDVTKLYEQLPAIYRIRDAEQAEPPLQALLSVIAQQVAVLDENLAQLYDDRFIETCAEWVVPYIGDLIGYRALNGVTAKIASPRAEVANTIAYRRRKGTASMLEQLARDVTGWDARVVEFFQLLATTQYMNHVRLQNLASPHLGKGIAFTSPAPPPNWERLERLNIAFESSAHTLDVRPPSASLRTSGRGRFNIPNIGIFLWRIASFPLTASPATRLDDTRYFFSPLGNNTRLYNRTETEDEITHLATPLNVPMPISRRVLDAYLDTYYGAEQSLFIIIDAQEVKAQDVVVCDLSDVAANKWAHTPPVGKVAVDPVLGRIALPSGTTAPDSLIISYHYGFSKAMSGGEYDRLASFDMNLQPVQFVASPGKIQDALDALSGTGAVEIRDSARYDETLTIDAGAAGRIELRAGNLHRPHLALGGDLKITGGADARVALNGLLISGEQITAEGGLGVLRLEHCTLVPGRRLDTDGTPLNPTDPSLVVNAPGTTVEIDNCIVGALRAVDGTRVVITNSLVDATAGTNVACAALDGVGAGGELHLENSTVVGKVHTTLIELASNVIFFADLAEVDTWTSPVLSERRQDGCVRFSYVPPKSLTPRRYQCQPQNNADNARVRPQFTSLRYGDPGYGQLSQGCAVEIRHGADDEAEMGAFHDLFQPQRGTNLRVRLEEYLRFGLEAGIIYAS